MYEGANFGKVSASTVLEVNEWIRRKYGPEPWYVNSGYDYDETNQPYVWIQVRTGYQLSVPNIVKGISVKMIVEAPEPETYVIERSPWYHGGGGGPWWVGPGRHRGGRRYGRGFHGEIDSQVPPNTEDDESTGSLPTSAVVGSAVRSMNTDDDLSVTAPEASLPPKPMGPAPRPPTAPAEVRQPTKPQEATPVRPVMSIRPKPRDLRRPRLPMTTSQPANCRWVCLGGSGGFGQLQDASSGSGWTRTEVGVVVGLAALLTGFIVGRVSVLPSGVAP